jgi:hypothetical protein
MPASSYVQLPARTSFGLSRCLAAGAKVLTVSPCRADEPDPSASPSQAKRTTSHARRRDNQGYWGAGVSGLVSIVEMAG